MDLLRTGKDAENKRAKRMNQMMESRLQMSFADN